MSSNRAAWQLEVKSGPYVVKEAPEYTPGPNEVLVKNHAIAINPADWKVQDTDLFKYQYPKILGSDVAGEIVAVGECVTHLKKGQRVIGHAIGLISTRPADSGFQLYTILLATLCAPIPDNMTYEQGCVLPLCLSTAADGLFRKDILNLQLPTKDAQPTGKTLLVWAGSSSVGSSATQLAVAAGYEVFATASPHNFQYCKDLGASQVFDYKSATVVEDIVAALKGKTLVGAFDAISESSNPQLAEIVRHAKGAKVICVVTAPAAGDVGGGVKAVVTFAPGIKDTELGPAIYRDFLPDALAEGRFKPKPDPKVVGSGLEACQEGVDLSRKGVSAVKLVVTL